MTTSFIMGWIEAETTPNNKQNRKNLPSLWQISSIDRHSMVLDNM